MVTKQVVTINVGGTGTSLSNHIWGQYYQSYGIDFNGKYRQKSQDHSHSIHNFFEESKHDGIFLPRNICIDADPSSINNLIDTPYAKLLQYDDNFITSNIDTDCGNLFPIGYHSELIDPFNKFLRKTLEKCDNLDGFIINHSMSGGMGSGFTSKILQQIDTDYMKSSVTTFSILNNDQSSPLPESTFVTAPYNNLLSLHYNIEYCNLCLIMDNYQIETNIKKYGDTHTRWPTYQNINEYIVKSQAMFTQPLRYKFCQHKLSSINSLQNMVKYYCPYPRLHFCYTSFCPLKSIASNDSDQGKSLLVTECQMFSVFIPDFDHEYDLYFAASEFLFGEIDGMTLCQGFIRIYFKREIYDDIKNLILIYYETKDSKMDDIMNKISFVNKKEQNLFCKYFRPGWTDWNDKDVVKLADQTQFLVANNIGSLRVFDERVGRKFDVLFKTKAYLHWYIENGMEESEFIEARENHSALSKQCYDLMCDDSD